LPDNPRKEPALSRPVVIPATVVSTVLIPKTAQQQDEDDAPKKANVSDWSWEPSEHDGLLTFHDGKKRWYHCQKCEYFNDRLYHSKMHFERIHVKMGKSMPRKRKYPNSSNVPITEDTPAPKSVLIPKDAAKSFPGKSTARLCSPTKSSPTKGRAASTKPADAASPAERSTCPRSPPDDAPSEESAQSAGIVGRWSAANARIFTFGDGSFGLKIGGRRIGEGVSMHVLDLKSPGSSQRARPADTDADAAGRLAATSGADAAEAADAAARSPPEDCASAPPAAAGRGRSARVRRSRVEIILLPSSDSIEDDDPALPAGPPFPGQELARPCGLRDPPAAHGPRCRSGGDDAGGTGSSAPSSPLKRRGRASADESSPDDHVTAGGRPARALRTRGGDSAASALPSPAMTPLQVSRLLRPRADRSATPGDGGGGVRRSFPPGTPLDHYLRTPTRPDADVFPCGGGDAGGADVGLSSPLLAFGSPAAQDRGRARRAARHAASGDDAVAAAAAASGGGGGGARLSTSALVWEEERLACHETLDHLAFDPDESEIYEWQRSLAP
jgi:hypothetical protein